MSGEQEKLTAVKQQDDGHKKIDFVTSQEAEKLTSITHQEAEKLGKELLEHDDKKLHG